MSRIAGARPLSTGSVMALDVIPVCVTSAASPLRALRGVKPACFMAVLMHPASLADAFAFLLVLDHAIRNPPTESL